MCSFIILQSEIEERQHHGEQKNWNEGFCTTAVAYASFGLILLANWSRLDSRFQIHDGCKYGVHL
jgi:hypothetical protein